jgi:hypothetical protein
MADTVILERDTIGAAAEQRTAARADDKAMLKAAADLTRDLNVAKPAVYWADLIGSALLGYAGLFTAILAGSTLVALAAAVVAVLALYRAGSFIHELTHLKPNAVPGFRLVWNLIVGIPLLVPSFMYEGVHNQHHAKRYYGTARRVRSRLAAARDRMQRVGDRTDRADRDRHYPAPRFPDLPRRRRRRDVPQPGADPGRASVGE